MKSSIRTHEALVTGAGQGIGQAIAWALAERGAQVIATDLNSPEETANKIQGIRIPTRCDAGGGLAIDSR
jgi:NAD(P)-dependent dehydrogenase (short-subunit alcohol dehydrogenase family)